MISANFSAVTLVVSAGLITIVLPIASAGASFHAIISSGEIPGDDLADDAERRDLPAGRHVIEFVGPAGVIEEMRGGHRHVKVTRLLDRLAAVERLGHGELAGAVLQQAGEAVDVFRPLAPGHFAPRRIECLLRRSVGGIDVGGVAVGDLSELRFVGRVDGVEILAGRRSDKFATDEMIVARLELRVGRLRRRIVFPEVAEDQFGQRTSLVARGRAFLF